jgi:DNA-directed RNA polymerase specialized sigma24 family protein
MREASSAAKELSIHLNNAFNANTGKLDLSKLDKSLKTSSTNVTELSTKLLNAGSQGQQAFVQLAQAISAADRPVVTLNAKFSSLLTTLKNTARWQLSSSVLHGFIGAYQQAMGYVKDLNASLTDIRIVTGKSIEDMARFAEEANRAAKALSTTTNEYAQASLIFYQQGLSEEEVAKRTEVTVKMANAAGQTAQTVSDQLTAVWNNFYDGSKSLEYYADVMTALGAATASSTDEIAGGLEKFAAIADTIGLSYEYAAAALATITANTRQSEDVVGTALKTIFARIQGLNLGETLDDGTTLNKYSEALQKVGISIFD